MNMQMRSFSFRVLTSIKLSFDVTGRIAECHNYSLGLKSVKLWVLKICLSFFNVFIKVHEYAS